MLRKDKPAEVEKIKALISQYSVIGLIDLHGMPTKQLQQIRATLKDMAKIRASKKNLLKRALAGISKKGVENLSEKVTGECALILTNENPFRLYKYVKENKTNRAAKKGDMAPSDIVVAKGSTGIPPGPSISTLQKVGLKTSVQDGKIAVMADKVVAKKGEPITDDMVNVFNLMKMEPIEIMLNIPFVLEDGVIYTKDVLDVDTEQYLKDLQSAIIHAINLSVNIGYPTKLTVPLMLQKAHLEAKAIAKETKFE